MGYALLFARSLRNTAKKNQLTYEQMNIQNQKDRITRQLSNLQQQENGYNQIRQYTQNQRAQLANNAVNTATQANGAQGTEGTNPVATNATNVATAAVVQANPMDMYSDAAYELTLESLQIQKAMLNSMSENLDLRLATIKTELEAVTAEETTIKESLTASIQNSAPKYVGM